LLDRVLDQLPGAVVFDRVEENPSADTCDAGAALCRENDCDYVIGIGGGSPMDAAKAVAGLACNLGPCSEYFGADRFENGALPVMAVPTTAGTGSEVTSAAVIVDAEQGVKRTIKGNAVFPKLALLDPETTVPLPRDVTVNTGLDALSQAMEGFVSISATPMTDLIALEVCHLVKEYLPRAAEDGSDIDARSAMLYAAMLSGCVIAHTGTTLVHGMGYYFTLAFGIPHGLANALLLTPLFQHNARCVPEKVAPIAAVLGVSTEPEAEDASYKIANALHSLFEQLHVSPAGKDHGVDPSRLEEFAKHIITDPYRFKNQVGDVPVDRVLALFEQACEGGIG
jgi:alcohol dehydrogenase class IV